MGARLYTVTVDCHDPALLARFWQRALGYSWAYDDADGSEVCIEPDDDDCPAVLFVKVPGSKLGKNRLHFDLMPEDQATEVQRLVELGAVEIDIGQSDVDWVVMADPEGNEFCVLRPETSD
jgi:predicted enzyme related to lactoylglutathione lyase